MKYYRGYEVSLLDSVSNKINHCSVQHHSVLPQMRMSIAHILSFGTEYYSISHVQYYSIYLKIGT